MFSMCIRLVRSLLPEAMATSINQSAMSPQNSIYLCLFCVKNLQTSIAKLFAGETVDFKWDKHDNPAETEELSTRKRITIKKLPPCLTSPEKV